MTDYRSPLAKNRDSWLPGLLAGLCLLLLFRLLGLAWPALQRLVAGPQPACSTPAAANTVGCRQP